MEKIQSKNKIVSLKPIVLSWIEDIKEATQLTSDKDVIVQSIREHHKKIYPEKHNHFEYVGAERKIRSDRGIPKGAYGKRTGRRPYNEPKLTGDAHFANTEGTILLREEEVEGEKVMYIDYPVIDRNWDTEGIAAPIEIVEWRTSTLNTFKREMIWGDLTEAEYIEYMPTLQQIILDKKTR